MNLKHVKPKVDSYWKKSDVPAANVKRSSSQISPPKLVTTKAVRFARAEVPQLITIKPDGMSYTLLQVNYEYKFVHSFLIFAAQTKKNAVGVSKRPIRRQESILSRSQSTRNAIAPSVQAIFSSASRSIHINDDISHSNNMLLHGVDDIDEADAGKLNLESEYVKDIYNYLQELEQKFSIPENYLVRQKEVNPKMRTVLIDWLNEVHLQFHLFTETYYLTVGIIDRYLQEFTMTSRKSLQLVGVAAMFLACKYEEMYPPMLKDFVFITDDTYSAEQITLMELQILKVTHAEIFVKTMVRYSNRFFIIIISDVAVRSECTVSNSLCSSLFQSSEYIPNGTHNDQIFH